LALLAGSAVLALLLSLFVWRRAGAGTAAGGEFVARQPAGVAPQRGPNFFNLDPNAIYEIQISHDGHAGANLSFAFYFRNTDKKLAVNAGGKQIPVPLINTGVVDATGANLNVIQSYIVSVTRNGQQAYAGTTGPSIGCRRG
jgi:hypothetical protein